MLGAGRYDRKVTFFGVTAGQDASGVEVSVEAEIGPAMASVKYGAASERRTAAGTEAGAAVTVRVRSTVKMRSVKVTDRFRIRNDTATYAVQGVAPIGNGRMEIEFTGSAALGAGA